jgi:hypothetical protein
MPDFERPMRKLEEYLATTPECRAYVAGMHAGMDKARWQIAKVCAGFVIGVVIYQIAKHVL